MKRQIRYILLAFIVLLALHPRVYSARSHLAPTALDSHTYISCWPPVPNFTIKLELTRLWHWNRCVCQFGRAEHEPAGSSGAR